MIIQIFIGLIVSFITGISTYFISNFLSKFKNFSLFQRLKDDVYILSSSFDSSHVDPYQDVITHSIPMGDSLALAYMMEKNHHLKIKSHLKFIKTKNEFDFVKKNNLIIIGGPMYNKGCRYTLENLTAKITYQFRRILDNDYNPKNIDMKNFINTKDKGCNIEVNTQLDNDYGTFIIVKNPWDYEKWIFIIAGLSTYSTTAAMLAMKELKYLDLIRIQKKETQYIVKCLTIDSFPEYKIVRKEMI